MAHIQILSLIPFESIKRLIMTDLNEPSYYIRKEEKQTRRLVTLDSICIQIKKFIEGIMVRHYSCYYNTCLVKYLALSSLPHRPTLLTRHSQVVWGDRQKGGEGRDLEGKGEDNMYLKRTKEGVWSSYINNNVSNISHPSLPPQNPAQMVSDEKSPSKLSKYIYRKNQTLFSFPIVKIPYPFFFCPPSTVRLVDCYFFCHIFHHPKPFTSWGGVGRNQETQMHGGGVRENIDLLMYVSQQQQQQQQWHQ